MLISPLELTKESITNDQASKGSFLPKIEPAKAKPDPNFKLLIDLSDFFNFF